MPARNKQSKPCSGQRRLHGEAHLTRAAPLLRQHADVKPDCAACGGRVCHIVLLIPVFVPVSIDAWSYVQQGDHFQPSILKLTNGQR